MIFPHKKMIEDRKLTEQSMLSRLSPGSILLRPLEIVSSSLEQQEDRADARLNARIPGEPELYRFVVESKTRATPQIVQGAIAQVRTYQKAGECPLIQVPYLAPERLEELAQAGVSGVDLCGNGVIVISGRIYVLRTGADNQYPDSRPLNNPYRGRSAMVARMLLREPVWDSLSALAAAINARGTSLSLPQVSKAVQAMAEDLVLANDGSRVRINDSLRLLDLLGKEWRRPVTRSRVSLRLPGRKLEAGKLSAEPLIKWTITGESSVTRYTTFSQGGPQRIAVSSLALALRFLGGTVEPVPNFADVELIESEEPGYYFDNETDGSGVRWASPLQTWLELQAGDARQRDAATDIRQRILNGTKP
jgi:hypothetical protein